PDIWKFKELKLRLLNGSHTFSCGLAMCCGFDTVKEAMGNPVFLTYVKQLMHQEIAPTLVGEGIDKVEASQFAESVIDRFSNPNLNPQWSSIGMNYSAKMRMRNLATLIRHFQRHSNTPQYMALGFAGYQQSMGTEASDQLLKEWE